MSETKELIERLRRIESAAGEDHLFQVVKEAVSQAASLLASQAEEIERLHDALDSEAIMAARAEAIEKCAAIADDVHQRNLRETYSAATDDGRLIFDSAQATAATIAAAIRSKL
jgi:hypothetical protein